jgi:hypothetical protein
MTQSSKGFLSLPDKDKKRILQKSIDLASKEQLTELEKAKLNKAVKKIAEEYGELLRRLADE